MSAPTQADAAQAQAALQLRLDTKEADLRVKETRLETEKADLRVKEARLESEKARLDSKEAALAAADKAVKSLGFLARAAIITEVRAAHSSAKAEVDAQKESVARALADIEAAKLAVTLQSDSVRFMQAEVESLAKGVARPNKVDAAEWISRPLPPHQRPSGVKMQRTTQDPEEVKVPHKFAHWNAFEQGLLTFVDALRGRETKEPVEQVLRSIVFAYETSWEGVWGPPRDATLTLLAGIFPGELYTTPPLTTPTNVFSARGGITDEVTSVHDKIVSIGERKAPAVYFAQDLPPHQTLTAVAAGDRGAHGAITRRMNLFYTTLQLYTYLVSKGSVVYGYISNYDSWVFFKRQGGARGAALLAPVRPGPRARGLGVFYNVERE
jgi:hypothetical protein